MTQLNDKALLVQLSVSQWTARKHDKRITNEVATAHCADSNAGRFNKLLLPATDKLTNIHKKTTVIRTMYYHNTLPWGIDGSMMLPTSNYLSFMTDFRKERNEWLFLVDEFVNDYEQLKLNAARLLKTMYDPKDYPSVTEVRAKFAMDIAVFPVPSTDFRVGLNNAELDRIKHDIEERMTNASKIAMQDVWQRLYDRVKHIAEKLDDPKAIFRDSMLENAREICALLPRINFTDDPDLEAMRQAVEQKLLKPADALRSNPAVRSDTAADAKDILDKMGAFMGAF